MSFNTDDAFNLTKPFTQPLDATSYFSDLEKTSEKKSLPPNLIGRSLDILRLSTAPTLLNTASLVRTASIKSSSHSFISNSAYSFVGSFTSEEPSFSRKSMKQKVIEILKHPFSASFRTTKKAYQVSQGLGNPLEKINPLKDDIEGSITNNPTFEDTSKWPPRRPQYINEEEYALSSLKAFSEGEYIIPEPSLEAYEASKNISNEEHEYGIFGQRSPLTPPPSPPTGLKSAED